MLPFVGLVAILGRSWLSEDVAKTPAVETSIEVASVPLPASRSTDFTAKLSQPEGDEGGKPEERPSPNPKTEESSVRTVRTDAGAVASANVNDPGTKAKTTQKKDEPMYAGPSISQWTKKLEPWLVDKCSAHIKEPVSVDVYHEIKAGKVSGVDFIHVRHGQNSGLEKCVRINLINGQVDTEWKTSTRSSIRGTYNLVPGKT